MDRQTAERDKVELALIAQLEAVGWTHLPGPALTAEDREAGRPLLTGRLWSALLRINPLPGQSRSWLDKDTADEAAALLHSGTSLRGLHEISAVPRS